MSDWDNLFIKRCFELARLGAGYVSPNPMVGAVLVHEQRIIGEGWHRRYGGAHAEVNCIASVRPADEALIPAATLYCSLEPCFHHGKTPPCVDLVLRHRIRRVVISNTDPNPLVAGQSVEKMRQAGVTVVTGVLEAEGRLLNRAFFKWISQKKPWIILKWAESADGFIGKHNEQTAISGPLLQRLNHRWRTEIDAILVGTHTALTDNPRLDNRLYPGPRPLRLAIDRKVRLPVNYHLLDDSSDTWIFGPERPGDWRHTRFLPVEAQQPVTDLLLPLAEAGKAILLVEGGANTLQLFIDAGEWDEIRQITSPIYLHDGVAAPKIPDNARLYTRMSIGPDHVTSYLRSYEL